MPRLMLLRHARAGPKPAGGRDFDRQLDAAGRLEAGRMGREMAARGWVPERVLCSPARRNRETLAAVLEVLGRQPETDFLREIYDGMEDDYSALIRAHGGEAETLLVVGHSPGIRNTAVALTAPGDPLRAVIHDTFPTAALAVLHLDVTWAKLRPSGAQLAAFLRPADLGGSA